MLNIRDLFQWDRFITPSIIKFFYLLAVLVMALSGLSFLFSGLAMMPLSPLSGLAMIISSLVGTLVGIIAIRIAAEFVLITFRINEHLGALRNRME
jgi:Domain of unknown function (DUF4282)